MRRRRARHGARALRPLGAARGASLRLRRLARRQQGEQRRQGRALVPSRRPGWKFDDIEKLRDVPLPAILFWNLNHFVVLEGFDEQVRAYINDPAQGPRLVSRAELDEAYSGVVLTFAPGPGFTPGGTPPDILVRARAASGRQPRSAPLRPAVRALPRGPRPRRAVVHAHLRRRLSDRRAGLADPAAAPRDDHRGDLPGRPHVAAAVLPPAARDQGRALDVQPLLQSHPEASSRRTSGSASPARSDRASRSTTGSPRSSPASWRRRSSTA